MTQITTLHYDKLCLQLGMHCLYFTPGEGFCFWSVAGTDHCVKLSSPACHNQVNCPISFYMQGICLGLMVHGDLRSMKRKIENI